jgi:hypothetical protein
MVFELHRQFLHSRGRDIERTVFTDVFVYRSGHWQAINAQEAPVRKPPSR